MKFNYNGRIITAATKRQAVRMILAGSGKDPTEVVADAAVEYARGLKGTGASEFSLFAVCDGSQPQVELGVDSDPSEIRSVVRENVDAGPDTEVFLDPVDCCLDDRWDVSSLGRTSFVNGEFEYTHTSGGVAEFSYGADERMSFKVSEGATAIRRKVKDDCRGFAGQVKKLMRELDGLAGKRK